MKASHSFGVIFRCSCDSRIGRPVYTCGPPLAQPTISVTRYLNPGGGTLWWASFTAGVALSRASDMTRSIRSLTMPAMLYMPPSRSYWLGFYGSPGTLGITNLRMLLEVFL